MAPHKRRMTRSNTYVEELSYRKSLFSPLHIVFDWMDTIRFRWKLAEWVAIFIRYVGHFLNISKIVFYSIDQSSLVEDPEDTNPSLDINIKYIWIHPNYIHGMSYNDIALIELQKDVDYKKSPKNIKPACLYWKGVQYTPVPFTLGIAGTK